MSFPRLFIEGITTGATAYQAINYIGVSYENDTTTVKPAYFTRARYDVQRQLTNLNISGGTATRYPNIPYTHVRLLHTWNGFIDVATRSVSLHAGNNVQEANNMQFIKRGLILIVSTGIRHVIGVPDLEGPNDPSLSQTYTEANETGRDWVYKRDGETEETTDFWMIKSMRVSDNQNGSSRLDVALEIAEAWSPIAEVIDTHTP